MYIVHIVQAHANVRPRAPRCSPAPQGNTRSRHTWSSSSREPSVIYVPPLEQGVVYRAGSTLYATPAPQQPLIGSSETSSGTTSSSHSTHPATAGVRSSPPPAIKPASIAPKLRRAAGLLTRLLKPWERSKSLVTVKPGSSTTVVAGSASAAVRGVTAATIVSSSDGSSSSSSRQLAPLVILLPEDNTLVHGQHTSMHSSRGSTHDLAPWIQGTTAVLPAANVLQAALLQKKPMPPIEMLLQHAACGNSSTQLISLHRAAANSSGSTSSTIVLPPRPAGSGAPALSSVFPAVPAAAARETESAGTLQLQCQQAPGPAAATSWEITSSSSSYARRPGCGLSYSATPAFSVPGFHVSDHGPSPFGIRSGASWDGAGGGGSSGSGGRSGANPGGATAAAARAAASGGFGALPSAPLKLARLGVAMMGMAAAVALAGIFWQQPKQQQQQQQQGGADPAFAGNLGYGDAVSDNAAAAAALSLHKAAATVDKSSNSAAALGASRGPGSSGSGSASAVGLEGSNDSTAGPSFNEWMVQRLQSTLQQFDAEQDMLRAELDMLKTLSSSKGSRRRGLGVPAASSSVEGAAGGTAVTGAAPAAASLAAAGGVDGMLGKVKRVLGFTTNTSTGGGSGSPEVQGPAAAATAAAAAAQGVASTVTNTELTPAAIASRIVELNEQIESLDVLKAALAGELDEQRQQQQQ